MLHSRQWLPCGALLLAGVLAAACTDSTNPHDTPAPATLAFAMDSSIYVISSEEGATPSLLLSGFISPSWSPDGRTLAMVATAAPPFDRAPPTQALYLADADGGNPRALTGQGDLIGGLILCRSDPGETTLETWIVSADGSNPVRIGPAGALVGGVAWSADSRRIAYFVSAPDDPVPGRRAIYLASPDGSGARPLVAASQVECCLSWRPSDPGANVVQLGASLSQIGR